MVLTLSHIEASRIADTLMKAVLIQQTEKEKE